MHEFDLIREYFTWSSIQGSIVLGVGDDAAICNIEPGYQLATSIDTLISGVHFPDATAAADIAHKALAVNLSDLAAMGAIPKYYTLALTMPEVNKFWLHDFSKSLKQLSEQFGVHLIGGDTTKGSLSITISIIGWMESGKALRRSGAQVGDGIYVSNTIGDAAFALWQLNSNDSPDNSCLNRLNRPMPQVEMGRSLVSIASACIDISDGLEQDLSHILTSSKVGAIIEVDKIPMSPLLTDYVGRDGDYSLVLNGGDDYELCFTVPEKNQVALSRISKHCGAKITQIGVICESGGLEIVGAKNAGKSYQHF
ncbi:MAG: thiamine-phosphate kinase [Gammaproteobacteria bacterium]|nr:thiamine-phosphate kinase [Gammaproteobacteria bacterium]